MALKDIKSRIATIVAGVAGVKNVHDHAVYAKDAEQENSLLIGDAGRLHCWTVSRESQPMADINVNEANQEKTPLLLIQGFYAVAEADKTEEVFDALVDAVIAALNTDRKPVGSGGTKLGGFADVVTPPQLRVQDHRQFGPSQTLCHHCEITMQVKGDQ